MTPLTFRSKIDTWIAGMLVAGAGLTAWTAVQSGAWMPVAITVGIFAGLVFPLRYELHEDALVVRSGFIRYRRPYATLLAATPNRSWISAPALSLDRLLISSSDARSINISPANRERFLAALAERAPQLR